MKNKMSKIWFYALSFTWGLPMTLLGLVAALILRAAGYKPTRWGGCRVFTVGEAWGGVNLGIVSIVSGTSGEFTKTHEFGHAVQNCKYGILMPFIVAIPSAIRYWYREIRYQLGYKEKTDYYDIWFEDEANRLGNKYLTVWPQQKDNFDTV